MAAWGSAHHLPFLKKGTASQTPLRATCRASLTTGISQWPEPKTDLTADSLESPQTSSCLPDAPYPFLFVLNSIQLCLLPPPLHQRPMSVVSPPCLLRSFPLVSSSPRTPVPVGSTVILRHALQLILLLASLPAFLTWCVVVLCLSHSSHLAPCPLGPPWRGNVSHSCPSSPGLDSTYTSFSAQKNSRSSGGFPDLRGSMPHQGLGCAPSCWRRLSRFQLCLKYRLD